jgi:hypothetical protein
MDHMATVSSASVAVVVVASLTMAMSTGALGACKTTLSGELVQAPGSRVVSHSIRVGAVEGLPATSSSPSGTGRRTSAQKHPAHRHDPREADGR